ncbi:MAG: glycosyltransferase family 4 protein [Saprospiraceae bacterium]
MSQKKIIFTVTNDLSYDQRMQRICTSLANANYDILLVGRKLKTSKELPVFAFRTKRIRCFFNKGAKFYAEYNFRLFFFLLFARFDVVCSIDLDTILSGFYTAKWRRKTQIYDAHEYFTEVPELVERPKIKAIWERIADLTIPNIPYAYTVGQGLQKIFTERYGVEFGLIRNVPFAIQQPIQSIEIQAVISKYNIPKTDKKVILYQGALNDGRGIEEAIRAMQEIDNAVLWLAGEGDLSQDLRQLVKQLELHDKVIFLGFVLPNDLRTITQLADIGLNLLRNKGLNYYYSLANKCFDYIQAEKPALHRSFPEYQAINEQFEIGILLDDLKIESIVFALQQLLNNPPIYKKLQANCRKAKAVYTWENESEKLVGLYDCVIVSLR